MIHDNKQKALTAILKKQMHIRLLAYHSKITPSAGNNGLTTEKQVALFYEKPIYKGRKHELF